MKGYKVQPLSYQELDGLSRPRNTEQPEGLPWVLYDTATFVSGTTTRLEFFTTLQTNKSLGNMDLAGSLTRGEYFMIYTMGLDILVPPLLSATGTPEIGALSDIQELLFGDAAGLGGDSGRFSFNMLSKSIGPFPISFLHASGGPTGFGWAGDTATGQEAASYANNGIFDGGFPFGQLVIAPNTQFSVVLEWGGTVTLVADRALRVWMSGVKYRPIR